MDKVSIRFGRGLQKVLKTDPDFFKEPTLQTTFAFVAFVIAMTASGKMPAKTFKVHSSDDHLVHGFSSSPRLLALLQEIYRLSDRIAVELEVGQVACCMNIKFHFYGKSKGTYPYLRFECGVESEYVRKFPSLAPAFL